MTTRLPSWFKQPIPDARVAETIGFLSGLGLHTVCQEARCPNTSRCFRDSRVTFMILGQICTRHCAFCGVKKSPARSLEQDAEEPKRICQAIRKLGLRYVVITSVTRDDLPDGGAGQFVYLLELVRKIDSTIRVELLIPDFQGDTTSVSSVVKARPDVLGHNIETVRSIYRRLKPESDYELSLKIIAKAKLLDPDLATKSSLMLGLGENKHEVRETMEDLREHECDILTLGQYLAPSKDAYPVQRFVGEQEFAEYKDIGLKMGFKAVLSGPLVRSSYQAEQVFEEVSLCTT